MKILKIIPFLVYFCVVSCQKQEAWLDNKSNKSDVIPSTISEYQALLDNEQIMNIGFPSIGIQGSDNSYVSELVALTGGTIAERNAYKWAADIYETATTSTDWTNPYKMIEYANVVLDGLEKIELNSTQPSWNNTKGSALFYRAFAYYVLAQLYCKPYSSSTANVDLGLPLKISSDVNEKAPRKTVQETYDLMLDDLKKSTMLLPSNQQFKTRPTISAANALLAKIYLSMEDYQKAKISADKVLQVNSSLLDFSTLNAGLTYPFPTFQASNPEILLYGVTINQTLNSISNLFVAQDLYDSYSANDLRKTIFFRSASTGGYNIRGKYTGNATTFSGLAINEVFLIRAECLAREGETEKAMSDLNKLLQNRWSKNSMGVSTYQNQAAATKDEALMIILQERRKELPLTGNTRWEDLRRLNKDPRFAKTLSRTISGITYTLTPNSPRYVFPIPPIELNINTIEQNLR